MESKDLDSVVDQLIMEYDDNSIPLPDIESEPHLLISKVRKQYMDYMIKLLSNNYETNQKLLNKNIYLPSAIWRCAKAIEMKAAQTCMVVQLYRKSILTAVDEIKNDTKKGKLNKKLFECLRKPAQNDKKIQTDQNILCSCQSKRRKKSSDSYKNGYDGLSIISSSDHIKNGTQLYKIPVAINSNSEAPQPVLVNTQETQVNQQQVNNHKGTPKTQYSVESNDELTMQLEKLFQSDKNDDDLFERTLGDIMDSTNVNHTKKDNAQQNFKSDPVVETHTALIKSLDERLATLAGMLVNNNDTSTTQQEPDNVKLKKQATCKWMCEEYFLKTKLYDLLYQIGEKNRKELTRIKEIFKDLFGEESDEESIVSPLDETSEFVVSCKERIAPWVVKLLTPYYFKGRIKSKSLFKALCKHLIRLIYQCSQYPQEYEVRSFVTDFLANHKTIRCEADFKEFKIEYI